MRVLLFIGKCIVGFLASIGLLLVLLVVAAGYGWQEIETWRTPEPEVPQQAVLTLDLKAGVVERPAGSPLARASGGDGGVPLRQAVAAIDAAAGDDRIKALAVRIGRGSVGVAQAQELHAAVSRFSEAGKPAFAFAETLAGGSAAGSGGTVHAYLSSAFDRVWMQPSGDYAVTGFRLESPYLRGALDELGIQPRIDQRRAYKGIKNRFTDREQPEPIAENQQRLVDSLLQQVTSALAQGRGLGVERVAELVDQAPLSAEDALAAELVDQLGYQDAFDAAVREAAGIGEDAADEAMLPLPAYHAERERELPEDAPQIALVYGQGGVALAESENNPVFGDVVMGSDTLVPAILDAAEDPEIDAIVLRVDSPGGSYVASDAIWRAVKQARDEGTPVVVSMGNIAASGGYFVAAPADRIYASPGTITGSIGVGSGKFVLTGLWDQVEVNFDGVQAGRNADFWSPNQDFSAAQWQKLQTSLDETYADFKQKVGAGRELSPEQVEQVAQGKIWSGADAKDAGLVDELGGLAEAIDGAKRLAEIPAEQQVRVVERPPRKDPLRQLLEGALSGEIDSPAARVLGRVAQTLQPLVDLVGVLQGQAGERRLQSSVTADNLR